MPSLFYPAFVIPPKQSMEKSVWFISYKVDTNDFEFRTKFIFRSRTDSHFPIAWSELYLDTMQISATATKGQPGILAGNLDLHEGLACSSVFEMKDNHHYPMGFFNNLSEVLTLDSLQSESSRSSAVATAKIIDAVSYKTISLPTDIAPNSSSVVEIEYPSFSLLGESKVDVTGYFTGKDTKQHYTSTVKLSFKNSILPEAFFFLQSNFMQSNDGKPKVNKEVVRLNSCSQEAVWVDSIAFTPAWSEDELKVVTPSFITFPFLLDPAEDYKFDVLFTPKEQVRKFGFAKGYFRKLDGTPLVRILDYQTVYENTSSVGEPTEESISPPSLLLTTPLLSMKHLGEYAETPQVYDSFGSSIDVSARLTQGVLSFEGLSSGVYCLIFKTDAGMVSRKVLYVR